MNETPEPSLSGGKRGMVIRWSISALSVVAFWWITHHIHLRRIGDIFSILLAYMFVVIGVIYTLGGRIPAMGKVLARSDLPTPSKAVLRPVGLTGITFLLGGVLLGAPPLLLPLIGDNAQAKMAVFAGIVVVFGVLTWFNVQAWRAVDEFYRRASLEGVALSFWVLQGALFLWAAAERFGLVPALNSWDAYTVLMATYLVLSMIVARRAGIK